MSKVNTVDDLASDLLALLTSSESRTNDIATDLLALIEGEKSVSAATGAASVSVSGGGFLSEIERRILNAEDPVVIDASQELTVLGQTGIWLNKAEVEAWRGDIPITEYRINEDESPQIITKRVKKTIEYIQELVVRYLRPPTPPPAGEIIITQETDVLTGPAPPLIIRQLAARAATPEPLIVREAPPEPPKPVGTKRITISGKRLPPPPRKVVIERLAPLPSKPQNVIIERWLPYSETKRRVIFNKAQHVVAEVAKPRNVIVQWETPAVNIKKEVKYLGVIRANPVEYVQKYGASLKTAQALPEFVLDIATPSDVGVLAADYKYKSVHELEGALEGFKYVNLDTEGLSEYRAQLLAAGIRDLGAGSAAVASSSYTTASASASARSSSADANSIKSAALQIFSMIDTDNSGSISIEEAESIVLKLNSRLSRSYGEFEVSAFFTAASGNSKQITRDQFVKVFQTLAEN